MRNFWEYEDEETYRRHREPTVQPTPTPIPPTPQPAVPPVQPTPQYPFPPVSQTLQPTAPTTGAQPQLPRGLPQWASGMFAGALGMLEDLFRGRTTLPQLQAQQQQRLGEIRAEPPRQVFTGLPIPSGEPVYRPPLGEAVGEPIRAWARTAAAYPRGQEALANVQQLFAPLSAVAKGGAGATWGLLTGQGPTWQERKERFEVSPLGRLWGIVRDKDAMTDPVNLFRDSFAELPETLQEDYKRWVAIEEKSPLLWRIPAEILFDPTVFIPLSMGAAGAAAPGITKTISMVRKVRYSIAAATAEPEELAMMAATYGALKGASWLTGKASEQLKLRKLLLWAGKDAPASAYEDLQGQADVVVDNLGRQGLSTTREEILAASRQVLYGEPPVPGIDPQVQAQMNEASREALRFHLNLNLSSLQAVGEIDPEMG